MAPRRRSSEQPVGAGSQVEAFSRGLVSWMRGQKYNVGLTGQKIDCPRLVEWAKMHFPDVETALAPAGLYGKAAGVALGLLMATMSGGATAEEATARLAPFAGYVDLMGFKVRGRDALACPVLFADDVPVEQLSVYIEAYADRCEALKDLTTRGLSMPSSVSCDALFVFFDPAKAAHARRNGGDLYFDNNYLWVRGYVVDVHERTVIGARADTFVGMIRQILGTDDGDFDDMALRGVLLPPRPTDTHHE